MLSLMLNILPGLMAGVLFVIAVLMLDCCFGTIRDRRYHFVMRWSAALLFLLLSLSCFSVAVGAVIIAYL